MKKKILSLLLAAGLLLGLTACGGNGGQSGGATLSCTCVDYSRINPAKDEHGDINILLFNGLNAYF